MPVSSPGGADKTLVSNAAGKVAWADVPGGAGLEPRVEALENEVEAQGAQLQDVEAAEQVNADAISANIDAIAAIASDVVDLADKQTTQ